LARTNQANFVQKPKTYRILIKTIQTRRSNISGLLTEIQLRSLARSAVSRAAGSALS
jgi:hypothetical protein